MSLLDRLPGIPRDPWASPSCAKLEISITHRAIPKVQVFKPRSDISSAAQEGSKWHWFSLNGALHLGLNKTESAALFWIAAEWLFVAAFKPSHLQLGELKFKIKLLLATEIWYDNELLEISTFYVIPILRKTKKSHLLFVWLNGVAISTHHYSHLTRFNVCIIIIMKDRNYN